jgi:hypothetical protein
MRAELRHLGPLALSIAAILFAAFACTSSSAETPPAPTSPPIPTPQAFIALADCPITTVTTPYVARPPYLAQPPEYYKSVWYGDDALWTMLDPGGEVWAGLPNNTGSLTQKTWWWSRNFEMERERSPAITVTGMRLDASGSFSAGNPGTHAYADFGTAMLVGVDIPATGCWDIRAKYEGAELAYVVLVE